MFDVDVPKESAGVSSAAADQDAPGDGAAVPGRDAAGKAIISPAVRHAMERELGLEGSPRIVNLDGVLVNPAHVVSIGAANSNGTPVVGVCAVLVGASLIAVKGAPSDVAERLGFRVS